MLQSQYPLQILFTCQGESNSFIFYFRKNFQASSHGISIETSPTIKKNLDTWGKMTILHHSRMGVGIYTFQTSIKLRQLLHRRVQTPSPRASTISLEKRFLQTFAAVNLSLPLDLEIKSKFLISPDHFNSSPFPPQFQ